MELMRNADIDPLRPQLTLLVDGQPVAARSGELVISVLAASGPRAFAFDDRGQPMGGYCWMGVCHACQVKIDGRHKQRACQTVVVPGMQVQTVCSRFDQVRRVPQ
jgi:hydrogen cyanide synthase HcnA